jgi:hypothetical protein
MIHDFNRSLKASHESEDLAFWGDVYADAFPTMVQTIKHSKDGDHQRLGIDRSVILENSKQILIDEKIRGRNKKTGKVYTDISLEYMSNVQSQTPGWVCKPLMCRFIAYAIAPAGICYLLDVEALQRAWILHSHRWMILAKHEAQEYRLIQATSHKNGRTWKTDSCVVPAEHLRSAMGGIQVFKFTPIEVAL